jgi:steroid delta-isomerase-like uncharacterized protein
MSTATDICARVQHEVFGSANLDLADELIAPDFVEHTAPPDSPTGPEVIKRTVRWIHDAFDEIRYDVEDLFGTGDRVALRSTFNGVHNGELFGHPATGRRVSVAQIHVFRVEDGRVAEHWATRDDLGMMRQLGLSA